MTAYVIRVSSTTGSTIERSKERPGRKSRENPGRHHNDQRVRGEERCEKLLPARRRNDGSLARQSEPGLKAARALDMEAGELGGVSYQAMTLFRLVPRSCGVGITELCDQHTTCRGRGIRREERVCGRAVPG